ncbi:glycosyltransferase family 4 protein [Microbacterium sp. NPDC089189]|uniref:glycosyltransferase family 4 protein n=1 Tax=Microbacterium sp. NPDC089189 TaxID=3154972 RepID=UPI00341D97C0
MKSILVVTPDLSANSTGRAWVWWLLATHLGWKCRIVSFRGDGIWAPVRGTEFAEACERIHTRSPWRYLAERASAFDAVVAVKPLPESLGVALRARDRAAFPLVVDVDDPDLEARLSSPSLFRRYAWRVRYLTFWLRVRDFSVLQKSASVAVSNPVLQARYGGTLLPHARIDPGPGSPHQSDRPRVAFIGTVRKHKGIDLLRDAVAQLADEGFHLIVTADSPADAQPWETWAGETSLAEGDALLNQSDIVALPSLPSGFAEGQLPAKLVDGMLRGRVVIASSIEPMPWALADERLSFAPGSLEGLVAALRAVRTPGTRTQMSTALRDRALAEFSVSSLAPRFEGIIIDAQSKAP